MGSLWTPDGERPLGPPTESGGEGRTGGPPQPGPGGEDLAAQVDAMRAELARSPVEVVVANHCYGLFELGAIYLSADPPRLAEARLAIDAFGLLVEGLGERLGESAAQLREALAQLRLGFDQVENARRAAERPPSPDGPGN